MFTTVFTLCDLKYIRNLELWRHVPPTSSNQAALYVIHTYLMGHPNLTPMQILETPENEALYDRWSYSRHTTQNANASTAASKFNSTSPAAALRGTAVGSKPPVKKQPSFLIEDKSKKATSRSFIDLSADDNTDSRSDISGYTGDNTLSNRPPRRQHIPSSKALLENLPKIKDSAGRGFKGLGRGLTTFNNDGKN